MFGQPSHPITRQWGCPKCLHCLRRSMETVYSLMRSNETDKYNSLFKSTNSMTPASVNWIKLLSQKQWQIESHSKSILKIKTILQSYGESKQESKSPKRSPKKERQFRSNELNKSTFVEILISSKSLAVVQLEGLYYVVHTMRCILYGVQWSLALYGYGLWLTVYNIQCTYYSQKDKALFIQANRSLERRS